MSGATVTRRASGPVKHLTPEEYLANPNTPVSLPTPQDRSAAQQVEALLRMTNRQIANLEREGLLAPRDLSQLSQLAGILASLVNAQRTANKRDQDEGTEPIDWSAQAK